MLSSPCLNLHNLDQLPELDHHRHIPSVMTRPGILADSYDDSLSSPVSSRRRIILVSNQLPIRAFKPSSDSDSGENNENENWQFELDEDALYLQLKEGIDDPEVEILYIGCLKVDVDPNQQDEVSTYLAENYRCFPVFIPEEVHNGFYHGFCKHYLWPLFHYQLPMSMGLRIGSGYDPAQWEAYVSANVAFAHKVGEVIQFRGGEDFVWIQDYHLMVLPTLLRHRIFRVRIGFFLHSPFPSSEIFRTIPVREDILRGLLNSDLVGFHTFDYARHFLSCCSRLLGLDYKSKRGHLGVEYYGRTVSLKILPVGIHMGQLRTLMEKPDTMRRARELRDRFEGMMVIVGVDDMDILKGIAFKFLALGYLLEVQPKLRGKLVLVQIVNPARSRGRDIQELQYETRKIVNDVNAKYRQPGYEPIVFIEGPVSTLEKAAYYSIADCCLLNAVRDGMNLVPYKYTVCRQGIPDLEKKSSMIIVSEFVGCSPSLSGAIRVNPFNVEQVAEAIHVATSIDEREKQLRHETHYKYISSHDIAYWARSFDQDLIRACGDPFENRVWGVGFGLKFRLVSLPPDFRKLSVDHIRGAYKYTSNRLILLDYDGTMTPQTSLDKPPNPEVIELLNVLCSDPNNHVFIVSGRGRERLDHLFTPCEKLGISAEHGYFTRWSKGSAWETRNLAEKNFEWRGIVRPIMELYAETTDGSSIEEKETSIVWHYRLADLDFGACQAKELLDHLENVLANEPVVVKRGKHIVEVNPQGVSKGIAVQDLVASMKERGKEVDFVLCIGDDRSDEEMFETIGKATSGDHPTLPSISEVFGCTVGQKPSMAKYYLDDTDEVVAFLQGLVGLPIKSDEAQESGENDGDWEVVQGIELKIRT